MTLLLSLSILAGSGLAQSAPAPRPCAGAPARPLSTADKEVRTDEIHFASGSAQLTEIGGAILDEVALRLKQEAEVVATIIGYIDAIETIGPNADLDRCRAAAVRDYIVTRHGIDPARITIQGRGGLDANGDNATAEGRLRNRRVVIRLSLPAAKKDE